MAMACFRDLTFAPLPLFSVPRLRRRMALATRFEAALPYLRVPDFLRRVADFFRVPARRFAGMRTPR